MDTNTEKLYRLLAKYESLGVCTCDWETILDMLGMPATYASAGDFEKNILRPTLDEINSETKLTVAYEKNSKRPPNRLYAFRISSQKGVLKESEQTIPAEDVERIVSTWNDIAETYGLPKVMIRSITAGTKRYKSLNARYKEYGTETIIQVVESVRESAFLQGRGKPGQTWTVTFDWIILPNNFPKVMEGKYLDKLTKDRLSMIEREKAKELDEMETPF